MRTLPISLSFLPNSGLKIKANAVNFKQDARPSQNVSEEPETHKHNKYILASVILAILGIAVLAVRFSRRNVDLSPAEIGDFTATMS